MNRKELRELALFTAILLSVLFLLDWTIKYQMSKSEMGSIAKVNAVMNHGFDPEISIWGSSTARVHFDAALIQSETGFATFNLGMIGTSFQQYQGLLKEYISYSKKARFLVLVVDLDGFESRSAVFSGYAWLNHINNENIYASLKGIDPDLALKSRYVPLYYLTSYDRRFLPRYLLWTYFSIGEEAEMINNGFHPYNITWRLDKHHRYDGPIQVDIDSAVVRQFGEVIDLALQKNIKVIVAVPPCFGAGLESITNLDDFQKQIASLERRGVYIFSYLNSPIKSDSSLYFDMTHLNARGAKILTENFNQDFKKIK